MPAQAPTGRPEQAGHLLQDCRAGVLTLTLNRPGSLNALTPELLSDIRIAVERAATRTDVGCIVITGAGRAFCSGQDMRATGVIGVQRVLTEFYNPLIRAIVDSPLPIVAAINGVAAGAGAALTLACDFRVMSDEARYAFLFVRVGLAADAGSSWLLPRLIGQAAAADLLLRGGKVEATRALELGLAGAVVGAAELERAGRALAEELAAGPASLGIIKHELRASAGNTLEQQLLVEIDAQIRAADTTDYAEGAAAFREKRSPRFTRG